MALIKKCIVVKMVMVLLGFSLTAAASSDGRNLTVTGGAKRIALVIGNDRYSTVTPLRNAVADARAMAAALERAGFAVTLKSDADLGAMKQAVRQFKARLSGGDEAVFFFAGHGVQLGAANYLLPVDITSDSEEQVRDDAIPLQRLLDDLQDQKVKFALAVIDACRDNPFKVAGKRSIGGTRGLAPTSAANGQMVIFSAGAGQQALDKLGHADRDENGVFTRVFLQEMQKPGVEVHQVLRSVRSRVVQMARSVNHDQMPAVYDQVEGDFYFTGSGTQVASLEPVAAPSYIKSREAIEQETWESARDSASIDAIREYLKHYPKGRFTGQARVLIATLKTAPAQPAEPVVSGTSRADGETDLWAEVQKGNSREDYQAYLGQYPKGKYLALAKARLKKLDDEAAEQIRITREAAAQASAQQEQGAWDNANSSASEAGYQSYLSAYPQGRYTTLAQAGLSKLQTEAAQAAANAPQPGTVLRDCADCPEMVVIPAGSFNMGSNESAADEKPVHRVSLRSFAMGKTEVTQGQWKAIMGNNPSAYIRCGDDCPVGIVSWNDAQAYIEKLNAKTGKRYRLPSEAEWEYACRAGGTHQYCGSDSIDSVAWYEGNSGIITHAVGQKQANGWGLYDMSGNVWEWVEDSYHASYDGAPVDGGAWSGDGAERVLRGGSWDYGKSQSARAAFRLKYGPANRYRGFGFRLARMLP